MKIVQLTVTNFRMESKDVPTLVALLLHAIDSTGNPIDISISEAQPLEIALRDDISQYKTWWLEERKRANQLEIDLKAARHE